ncbi:MAG: DUF4386 domain-containing protein [Sphingomicrobium sp.]
MHTYAVAETSPDMIRRRARLTGAMYIPYLAFGMPLFLRAPLIVPRNAAATAANILASETLYRITVITDLVSYVLYIALAYLFYVLLREVNRPWAALATLFTLAGCIVLIVSTALLTAPLLLLDSSAFHAIALPQRQELALVVLKLFAQGYTIGLFLFGAQWLIMGPLFARSRLVPRLIGYWLLAGGIGWVALAVATLLGSPLRTTLQAFVLPVAGLAEIALGGWLLVFAGWKANGAEDETKLA